MFKFQGTLHLTKTTLNSILSWTTMTTMMTWGGAGTTQACISTIYPTYGITAITHSWATYTSTSSTDSVEQLCHPEGGLLEIEQHWSCLCNMWNYHWARELQGGSIMWWCTVVIKAMHIHFISIIKENKLKINSSRVDECVVVYILYTGVRDLLWYLIYKQIRYRNGP